MRRYGKIKTLRKALQGLTDYGSNSKRPAKNMKSLKENKNALFWIGITLFIINVLIFDFFPDPSWLIVIIHLIGTAIFIWVVILCIKLLHRSKLITPLDKGKKYYDMKTLSTKKSALLLITTIFFLIDAWMFAYFTDANWLIQIIHTFVAILFVIFTVNYIKTVNK